MIEILVHLANKNQIFGQQARMTLAAIEANCPLPAAACYFEVWMLRLAGMVSFRKDGRMVFYRLSDGFPHPLLEHCLRQLLSIASPEGHDASA
jgi:DNA-binding transcriptional ArsR family regulator